MPKDGKLKQYMLQKKINRTGENGLPQGLPA